MCIRYATAADDTGFVDTPPLLLHPVFLDSSWKFHWLPQDLADDLSMDIEELYLAQDNDSCDIEYENCNPDHQDEDDEEIPCSAPEQGVSSIFCDSEGQACQKLVGLKRCLFCAVMRSITANIRLIDFHIQKVSRNGKRTGSGFQTV